jgi:hypothetical protein
MQQTEPLFPIMATESTALLGHHSHEDIPGIAGQLKRVVFSSYGEMNSARRVDLNKSDF